MKLRRLPIALLPDILECAARSTDWKGRVDWFTEMSGQGDFQYRSVQQRFCELYAHAAEKAGTQVSRANPPVRLLPRPVVDPVLDTGDVTAEHEVIRADKDTCRPIGAHHDEMGRSRSVLVADDARYLCASPWWFIPCRDVELDPVLRACAPSQNQSE